MGKVCSEVDFSRFFFSRLKDEKTVMIFLVRDE